MPPKRSQVKLPDIKPQTPVAALDRERWSEAAGSYAVEAVAPLVGMSPTFIRKVLGRSGQLSPREIVTLLDQDAFAETFVPRSNVLDYLEASAAKAAASKVKPSVVKDYTLINSEVTATLPALARASVQCVVTSTPYWGMRIYEDSTPVVWADGESAVYGHEQTPEGFIRHTLQILQELRPLLTSNASVWWNLMDTYNTRTQIRGNAAEALRAMQGKDDRSWADHDARRYSAGHAYLKDGEQSMIPARVAERASRMGYLVKSVITWVKPSNLPEPQNSRVSRAIEYVLHLTTTRTPKFDKMAYRRIAPALGGRNTIYESDKLSDFWVMPTSSGLNGHGAQFPTSLPGRCIALSTDVDDLVLDPFVGSGNSGVAARYLGRRFIGIDVSARYLASAEAALKAVPKNAFDPNASVQEDGEHQEFPRAGFF